MQQTGRIGRTVRQRARRILFGENADAAIDRDLPFMTEVDRAHLLMLVEQGLLAPQAAASLLRAIDELCDAKYAPLRGAPAPRGLFLLYERYLMDRVGPAVGGMLQLGRSRNDLNATVLRMRMRGPCKALVREALRLSAVLLCQGRRHADVVMPAYTHGQPALPITYGHYLLGVATALSRDIDGLLDATADLQGFPLGAGAAGGTSLPIAPARTAALLGFGAPKPNSVDAVASRDVVLRVLAAASVLGVTLSRVATDHLTWTGAECDFLGLPDHVVGSSSMMPQKRNPYFLEHVQGKTAAAAGALTQALMACHAKPFTNTIAVGTEAVSGLWNALTQVTDAITLLRLVLAEAQPKGESMARRAEAGYTVATELANQLVVQTGMSFRNAHHQVGELISEASAQAADFPGAVARWNTAQPTPLDLRALDAASVARRSDHGGGPGQDSCATASATLAARWTAQVQAGRERDAQWQAGSRRLAEAVAAFLQQPDGWTGQTSTTTHPGTPPLRK